MDRVRSGLLYSLLLAVVVGCQTLDSGDREEPVRLEPTAEDLEKETENWYGAYSLGRKIGWSSSRFFRRDGDEGSAYVTVNAQIVQTGPGMSYRKREQLEFATEPPYVLLRSRLIHGVKPSTQEVSFERMGGEIAVQESALSRRRIQADDIDYTLVDMLTPAIWFSKPRQPGDRLRVREYDASRVEMSEVIYEVVSAGEKTLDGVTLRYLECVYRTPDGNELSRLHIDRDGRTLSLTANTIDFRLEEADVARQVEGSLDLAPQRIPLDQPLDREGIGTLILEMDPADVVLPQTLHQQTRKTPDGRLQLALGTPSTWDELDADEQLHYLRETVDYPLSDPRLEELLVSWLPSEEEVLARHVLVETVLEGVGSFMESTYEPGTRTVSEILRRPRGDCTEHSRLFVALARKLGIPAREVSGLVYDGEGGPAFHRHRWCEVHDRGWRRVDPTRGWAEGLEGDRSFPTAHYITLGYPGESMGVVLLPRDVRLWVIQAQSGD